MILNNKNWKAFASAMCVGDTVPEDYSPGSMERLMKEMDDYIISVKNVRPQFHARNGVKMVDFTCEPDRLAYHQALETFEREKAKLEKKEFQTGQSQGMCILAQLIIFQMAAEKIKANSIADAMFDSVTKYGKTTVAAFKYKNSIVRSVKQLLSRGVKRDQISIIWGGGKTKVDKKKAEKLDNLDKLEKSPELLKMLQDAGIDLYDIGLGTVNKPVNEAGDNEIKTLKLGAQSKDTRQEEIDKFQRGETLYCFFTFKAGGVGLSLHHTDELTAQKCRRKESGYVYEEDIPSIPTRPREMYCAVTYSAIELVQALGRCPRMTSLSDTNQVLLFYRGTLEEHIAHVVGQKLKCLSKVVRQKESWEDVILNYDSTKKARWDQQDAETLLLSNSQSDGEEGEELLDVSEDDEEED